MEEAMKLMTKFINSGLDPMFFIKESFLGYKYRKSKNKLYSNDAEIPTTLIKAYYLINWDTIEFDKIKSAFVNKYIKNESEIEEVNKNDIHGKVEIEGLKYMYEYIHSSEINYMFDVYTLLDLHRMLFKTSPHPECAGTFRNFDVYLPGTGTDLSEWSMIRPKLEEINKEILVLINSSKNVRESKSPNILLDYLDKCIEIKCKLIKVHPFSDGNGRVIRGFINKLIEDVNLPPIYIKVNERTEYHKAMNKANNENDYTDIKNFYRYKICDSIIELDINNKVREEKDITRTKQKRD